MVHLMSDSIFNEDEYLAANPDVALAVKAGQYVVAVSITKSTVKGRGAC